MAPMTRRHFLKASIATAATLAFPSVSFGDWKKVSKVVIVRFGGGVRYSETIGDPQLVNLPQMRKLLPLGTLYTRLYNEGVTNHVGGTLQILTGAQCGLDDMARSAPKLPTLFEYYRKFMGRRAPAHKAICIEHSTLNVSYTQSADSDFGGMGGQVFSPRLLMYEHLFRVMESEQDTTSDVYRQAKDLRDRIWVKEDFEHIENPDRSPPAYTGEAGNYVKAVMQKAKVPVFRSSAVGDELVWYFAQIAMGTIRPDVLVINFAGPDVAHKGSFSDYLYRIRMVDHLTSLVHNEIRKNRAYANTTLFLVTPDCGRSLPGVGKGGFTTHSSGDDGCRHLWALAIGPGVKKRGVVTDICSQYDLAPTVGKAMGFETPKAAGRPLKSL
jgi:hypothetical protein